MSRDEFSLPTITGAEENPGLGGPALPQQAAEGISLRSCVMEPIKNVLFDPDPKGEWRMSVLRSRPLLTAFSRSRNSRKDESPA
ncbi:hypothetical protein [Arthrobacter sp. HMWF013]|uniref:hypothetical protein n=1 Tax=Arthrobacter sp. HMWF013 TaxID=2056849 RepID=UPI000D34844D|nr:hypothetical protein [Arthrobacter sp. HMWF013]PTT59376.1 hypothetical protein DBR22_21965 [Arthrobacter sp. HMWF013]